MAWETHEVITNIQNLWVYKVEKDKKKHGKSKADIKKKLMGKRRYETVTDACRLT